MKKRRDYLKIIYAVGKYNQNNQLKINLYLYMCIYPRMARDVIFFCYPLLEVLGCTRQAYEVGEVEKKKTLLFFLESTQEQGPTTML